MGNQRDPLPPIDEHQGSLDSKEFYAKYVRLNKPVVIRGGIKDQPYFSKWKSDKYLVKNFGDTQVLVEKAKVEDRAANVPIEDMSLRQYIKGYQRPGHEWYIVQDVYPHMLRDIEMPHMLRCEEFVKGFNMVVMWFSSGGTSSVLHSDEQENILSIVQGKKELLLWAPDQAPNLYVAEADRPGIAPITQRQVDMELFPKFAEAEYSRVTLHEGDMLYIPRKWYHQVESPRNAGRNLGVNFWWYVGGLNPETRRVKSPFGLPPQPENFGAAFHGNMLNKQYLTPQGKYGGYKLKWPEQLQCKKLFPSGSHIAKVHINDHEYVDGLERHNEHQARIKAGQPAGQMEEEEDDGDHADL